MCDLFPPRTGQKKSKANMSDKGTVSPKEKEATEKRGRGRPRKQPQVKTSDVSSAYLFLFIILHLLSSLPVHNTRICIRRKGGGVKTT